MSRRITVQTRTGAWTYYASLRQQLTSFQRSFPFDPILQYRPSFSCSLPIQILMTGIVLTLASVLLVHLVFTGQYHWPLAPVNYALQLSAVVTLLISLIATLRVVLETATEESRHWPYMLNYIAVDIPPLPGARHITPLPPSPRFVPPAPYDPSVIPPPPMRSSLLNPPVPVVDLTPPATVPPSWPSGWTSVPRPALERADSEVVAPATEGLLRPGLLLPTHSTRTLGDHVDYSRPLAIVSSLLLLG